jgi:hypothetical protein
MERTMPRYFFHLHDGIEVPDRDGVEIAGPNEARVQALIACGEAIKELRGTFWEHAAWQMQVVDERGTAVCTLTLSGSW